jgi:hypothetical protein
MASWLRRLVLCRLLNEHTPSNVDALRVDLPEHRFESGGFVWVVAPRTIYYGQSTCERCGCGLEVEARTVIRVLRA